MLAQSRILEYLPISFACSISMASGKIPSSPSLPVPTARYRFHLHYLRPSFLNRIAARAKLRPLSMADS